MNWAVKFIRGFIMLHKKETVKIEVLKFLGVCLFIFTSQNVFAEGEQDQNKLNNWQMKKIYQPGKRFLERENRGFVNIYDGFSENQVDQIMDEKFERIDHMMFTRVKKTDIHGDILIDPISGHEIVTDDGCD